MNAETIRTTDGQSWGSRLAGVPHDVYHTLGYHALAEQLGEGSARLFVYRQGERTFAFPYLLRPIPDDNSCFDITSVYGYPGPVASPGAPPGFLHRASAALRQSWVDTGVVCAFTRFNPLLGNDRLMPEWDANSFVVQPGHSVSMDLRLTREQHQAHYPKTVRQEIAAARRRGMTTTEDPDWRDGDAFVALYNGAMRARSAPPSYLLAPNWVQSIRRHLNGRIHLFCTRIEAHVVSAICVLEHHGILHAHLTGSDPVFAAASPLKLLLDDVGDWCRARGATTFHLGGGVGGKQDSLFEFKRRLSSRRDRFAFGGWIVDRNKFDALSGHAAPPLGQGFFPPYRDPAAVRHELLTLTAR